MKDCPDACPACGITWVGQAIPAEDRWLYGDLTHFPSGSTGLIDAKRDELVAWGCNTCGHRVERTWPDIAAVHAETARAATKARNAAIRAALAEGATTREIGEAVGMSHAAVQKIGRALREKRPPP